MTHTFHHHSIVVAAAANRGNTAYDTALYNAATMYVAQQNKTGGGRWVSDVMRLDLSYN